MDAGDMDTSALDWSAEGCSIEAALNVVSDRQTFLVMREVVTGRRRFSDIRELTGMSRQVLSDRLARLVDQGLLRRHRYQVSGDRPREEYRLTEKGFALFPVLLALLEWGNTYACGPGGPTVRYVHRDCGEEVELVTRCAAGHELADPREALPRPGPGARLRSAPAS